MATKTIALDREAYELLRKRKRKGESFSDAVKRIAREPRRLSDLQVPSESTSPGARSGKTRVSKSVAMSPPFRRFLDRLARDLRPERVVLYGSRARGTHRPTSDYDMLIVARRFQGVPWVERAALAIRLWDLPVDLEPICLTPEEFRRRSKEISIVGVAAREGIVVFP